MTREEAIEFGNIWLKVNKYYKNTSTYRFFQIAIKVLDQKPTAKNGSIDYCRAFKIACELLNGAVLYGADSDKIFEIMVDKDGVVSKDSYEEYILNHLQELDHGEYVTNELEQEPVFDRVKADIRKKMKFNSFNEGYVLYDDITEVLDKYKSEQKEDSFTDECKILDGNCGACSHKHNCCSSEYRI